MSSRSILFTFLILCSTAAIFGQTAAAKEKKSVSKVAKGTFVVKVVPQKDEAGIGHERIGRLSIAKTFAGDLIGTSAGQMLGSQFEEEPGTGGYVAMEVVSGTLNGKKGSFSLQHIGTMDKNGYEMRIEIVPGSGTEELKGISGKCKIEIKDGKHFYELDYQLP